MLDADGNTLAVEAHHKAGEPHAEAHAIAAARAAGVIERLHTVVVTLEPCNHSGRTPPCTAAILTTPARDVWIGAQDPNPAVAGGGAAALAAAGLTVRYLADLDGGDADGLREKIRRLNAPFAKRVTTGLPYVTVKQAVDSRGSMIPPPGQRTFTSQSSLVLAHEMRRRADAILTGSGTVLADDPAFTVRLVPDHPDKRRTLVIADRRGRVAPDYVEAARLRGFDVERTDDIADALRRIGAAGALEVLVEAGPSLTGYVLSSGLWDEHVRITHRGNSDGSDLIEMMNNSTTTP